DTAYPDMAAQITYRLMQDFAENVADLLLHPQPDVATLLAQNVNAYQQATERILGAAPGSLHIFDAAELYEKWFA
ncbi:MAG: hypothetical protein KDE50_13545, partial [Caldilineaceae bacterium]|nr:hypothetical protein [Caldilineaceae bacterium]